MQPSERSHVLSRHFLLNVAAIGMSYYSSVGIGTGYGLDDRDSTPSRSKVFFSS
jgi:hypothetical protein